MEGSGGRGGWMRPPLRERLTESEWLWIDVAVAVAAFAAALFRVDLPRAVVSGAAPPWAPVLVLLALGTLPFAVRRRQPLAALAVMALAASALTGLGWSPPAVAVTVGIAAYTVAAGQPRRTAVAALVVVEAALCAGAGVAIARDVAGAYAAAVPLVSGVLWFAGDSVSYRRKYAQAVAAEEARRHQAEQDQARQAIREERVRIAREIHDVVAHSLTVMTVQAGVARRVMQDPGQARGVLESIESTGRVAQDELRLILGLLRDDERDEPGLSPAPDLGALPALVEEVRAAGVPVELRVRGDKPAISPALELSVYRVVQEALTNTVRHAGRAPTTIDLTYGPADIRVEVVNGAPPGAGRGPEAAAPAGAGHGILGMRERVSAFGGTLAVGPVDGAGFRVSACVPLRAGP